MVGLFTKLCVTSLLFCVVVLELELLLILK